MAGSFETENTGGVLTGFLAEEEAFDRSSLWRLGSWGVASVAAIIIALYTSQSSIGLRHEQAAAADLARQAQQIQLVSKESQSETRRLASAVDTLNGDRDRLYSRITLLEQGLDSVTGAIARQAATVASPQVAATSTATSEPQIAAQTPAAAQVPAQVPAPVAAPVATTVAKAADKPPMEKTAPEQAPATVASVAPKASNTPVAAPMPTTVAKAADKPPIDKIEKAAPEQISATVASVAPKAVTTPAAAPAPLVAAKSMMGPPDAAATKLIEPEKPAKAITSAPMPDVVASAPPADNAEPDETQATAPRPAVQRTEFGIDLGTANSIGGLRALWRGLLKSRSNVALTTLRPIIVIREGNTGLGMQLRLVAGPLDDAAAAAKICAGLIESARACETTVFDGQRLAMKADEPNAADKTAAQKSAAEKAAADTSPVIKPAAVKPFAHKWGHSKRAAIEEPAKKPDSPSVLSSFFSRR